jgi:ATP-binding cassette subfamily G (WHITE) protein 2 (SNQ2)
VHKQSVQCIGREEAKFSPPPGMTCQGYAGAFAAQSGGYVEDSGNGMCSFCQYSTGDQFVSAHSNSIPLAVCGYKAN